VGSGAALGASGVQDRQPIPRTALAGHATEVAPRLLGATLCVGRRCGRVVEVEAYGGADDPASHAYQGRTERNESMFGRPGTLYCYRSYGIHTCANLATGAEGEGQAVLLRAIEPVGGIESMWQDRPAARRERDLANGPGKLCEALGIGLQHDGLDVCDPRSAVALLAAAGPVQHVATGPRVGISRATHRPWRFWVHGSEYVSR